MNDNINMDSTFSRVSIRLFFSCGVSTLETTIVDCQRNKNNKFDTTFVDCQRNKNNMFDTTIVDCQRIKNNMFDTTFVSVTSRVLFTSEKLPVLDLLQ
jgi:hypothetical protein